MAESLQRECPQIECGREREIMMTVLQAVRNALKVLPPGKACRDLRKVVEVFNAHRY
jgi:hypothetical protein